MSDFANLYRFLVSPLPDSVTPGLCVSLPDEEAHHACSVLRLRAGEKVELFDGAGRSATGKVTQIQRHNVTVELEQIIVHQRVGPEIELAFAVPKGKRLDWLLEKATELGAAALSPVIFERSVAGGDSLSEGKRQRWLGHCIAAAKQCGLNFLPRIDDPMDLPALLAASSGACALLGDPSPSAIPISQALDRRDQSRRIVLLIGPEGGITPGEMQAVVHAGFQAVRIGQMTLRVETAAIAMLSAAAAICG